MALPRPCLILSPLQETLKTESMRTVVDVLLELGGDLGRVDSVGNDILAIAGEVAVPQLQRTRGACDMPVRPCAPYMQALCMLEARQILRRGSAQGGSAKVL